MRFWDSSAIVPLFAPQPGRERLVTLLERDPDVIVWWATPVEVTSALARLERAGALPAAEMSKAMQRLDDFLPRWRHVTPTDEVRRTAQRLLRTHPLRAQDALQLAAALVVAGPDVARLELVCLDLRLAEVARREGFAVLA